MKNAMRFSLVTAAILMTVACLGTQNATTTPIGTGTSPLPEVINPSEPSSEIGMPSRFLGLTITYLLDGNIWLWDGATPARQLTNDGDAVNVKLSDDGNVIVYQRGQSIWAVNKDGSSPRLLVDVPAYATPILPRQPAGLTLFLDQIEFQPNTHWVYFTTAWGGSKPTIRARDLHHLDADSPMPQTLHTEGAGQLTFSQDGKLLALVSLTEIKVINEDGTGLVTALTYPVISTIMDYYPQVVWLSNGTGFYTVIPNDEGGPSRYLFVSADGSFNAQLSEYDGSIPVISPDGLKVAYAKLVGTTHELHVVEASNTDTIIAIYEGAPTLIPWNWSTDSRLVTFSNAHPVLVLTAGIGIPTFPLTESITPNSLRWISPDHFIFFREGILLVGQINNPETILIASGFTNEVDTNHYDFTINPVP